MMTHGILASLTVLISLAVGEAFASSSFSCDFRHFWCGFLIQSVTRGKNVASVLSVRGGESPFSSIWNSSMVLLF